MMPMRISISFHQVCGQLNRLLIPPPNAFHQPSGTHLNEPELHPVSIHVHFRSRG
jgi:hypothetical protein